MNKHDRIYVAGHRGLVGSAIVRCLESLGYDNLILRRREELDLTNQTQVRDFFNWSRPQYVFLAAAKVGGISANSNYPAAFVTQNIQIQSNVIESAFREHVERLLFLGSSCIYPKFAEQPIKESSLMTGSLEATNRAYATAKLAGVEMCRAYNEQFGTHFHPVMPTNLYGPGDNYDTQNSHVVPALIRKIHTAKKENRSKVTVWGSGTPLREFLYSDDLADACVFLMNHKIVSPDLINIGSGIELSISELAAVISDIIGFDGEVEFDRSKPDGTPRKILDSSKIRGLGWQPQISFIRGIQVAYEDFLRRYESSDRNILV